MGDTKMVEICQQFVIWAKITAEKHNYEWAANHVMTYVKHNDGGDFSKACKMPQKETNMSSKTPN